MLIKILTIKTNTGKINKSEAIMDKSIDKEVLEKYNTGIERNRLRMDLGLIEFARTKEIILENIPPKPSVIYDIGGGYGEYSWWLASLGHNVYLYDISEKNIEMAEELASEYPGFTLKTMRVADARKINQPDNSADAIILFGPLYHIVDYEERQAALLECYRLLKNNGVLFTAAITRYATTLWAITTYGVNNDLLGEPEFIKMIQRELKDGQHIKNEKSKYRGMGRSFFHLPEELEKDICVAGFKEVEIRGVIGPLWLIPNLNEQWKDIDRRESIMRIARMLEKEQSIMGLSTHLVSIAKKKEKM
jgi:ubiquinone/menaquinone biosynthesis C-methylase UbiE